MSLRRWWLFKPGARAIVWRPREKGARFYPDSQDGSWVMAFVNRDVFFEVNEARNLDARMMFCYAYTAVTSAMAKPFPGLGSDPAVTYRDSKSQPFDGAKTYRLHIPADPPVKTYWAVKVFDPQTSSIIQTDQQSPTMGSHSEGFAQNDDDAVEFVKIMVFDSLDDVVALGRGPRDSVRSG